MHIGLYTMSSRIFDSHLEKRRCINHHVHQTKSIQTQHLYSGLMIPTITLSTKTNCQTSAPRVQDARFWQFWISNVDGLTLSIISTIAATAIHATARSVTRSISAYQDHSIIREPLLSHIHKITSQILQKFKEKKCLFISKLLYQRHGISSPHTQPQNPTMFTIHLVLLSLPPRTKTIIRQMEKSILPPLHINTKAATTVRTPSAVFTLVVIWIEAFVTFPHFLR
jgi:hypothetical protein